MFLIITAPLSCTSRMEIISRELAKASGLVFYCTGAPCAQGHLSDRYTSTGACRECSAEDSRRQRLRRKDDPALVAVDRQRTKLRYWADPGKFRDKAREHRVANPLTDEERRADAARRKRDYIENIDREKAYRRQWREKNKDKKSAQDAQWQRDNPDRVKQRNRRWQEKNKDAVRSFTRNYRAKKRAAEGFHTGEDIKALFDRQRGLCACGCGASIESGYDVDHIIPVSRGGDNWPSNLQLLTPTCNKSKNDKTMEEWMLARSATSACVTGDNRNG
jgi:5-methylcytosine-specific restriction endonuclease McrA